MASTLRVVDTPDRIGPRLPYGRRVELPGRGTTFVREVEGPPGAPTLLLLHGWLASGGLNWFQAFPALGEHFRVVAPDLRGHARGLRSRRRFRLVDCADDAAALLAELDAGPVIAVGYSLGGAVAQLLWRRHRELVDGLVLCATAHHLMPGRREQAVFASFMAAAAGGSRFGELVARAPVRQVRALMPVPETRARPSSLREWARAEMRRHDMRLIVEAGWAMASYNAPWVDRIDVPTAMLITTRDRAISPHAQFRTAVRIPGATLHRIDDGHVVCAKRMFAAPLVDACMEVASRTSGVLSGSGRTDHPTLATP
ncbi:MAG: alpha/beta fold hydrolase [Acidimicrobiales bacterium]